MSRSYRLMKSGRAIVYEPSHTRAFKTSKMAGYVYEYLVIAEKMLGRPILNTEVVHHINGNSKDDRPENLIVMHSNSDHIRLHNNHLEISDLEKLPDGSFIVPDSAIKHVNIKGHKFKVDNFTCINCGKTFTARKSYRKNELTFCSRSCCIAYHTTDAMSDITKDKLEIIMKQYKSYVQAAKYLWVSNTTVKKYCKRFGIVKPA